MDAETGGALLGFALIFVLFPYLLARVRHAKARPKYFGIRYFDSPSGIRQYDCGCEFLLADFSKFHTCSTHSGT